MNAEQLLQRAQLLLQQHRPEQAKETLHQLLAHDPSVAQAHSLLALCLLNDRDQWHEATREAEQGIHLAPDSGFAHFVRASTLEKRNQFEEALRSSEEALRLEPYQSHFHALHASILGQMKRWNEALDAATQGLAIDPDDTSCANMRTLALERLGRTGDSLQQANAAVQRNPDSGQAHAMRGWALMQKGEYRQAQDAFREALRLNPTDEFAQQGMIQALNSNNFLFRIVFKFYSFMGRLGSSMQWAIIIGLFVGMRALRAFADANPEWKPYVLPISMLYLGFCLLSWIANPLFNTFLRFHPFGKYLLSRRQKWASNLIGVALGFAVLSVVMLVLQQRYADSILIGLVPLFLTLPISLAFDVDRGWPQWVAGILAVGMSFLGLITMTLLAWDGPWGPFFVLYSVAILILSFLGNWLRSVTVRI